MAASWRLGDGKGFEGRVSVEPQGGHKPRRRASRRVGAAGRWAVRRRTSQHRAECLDDLVFSSGSEG